MAENSEQLTAAAVAHVAKLARLSPSVAEIERYRQQLGSILGHISKLREVDTKGVEPMAHPLELRNRLAADEPGTTLTVAELLANAPARTGDFIAVPKVLDEGSA